MTWHFPSIRCCDRRGKGAAMPLRLHGSDLVRARALFHNDLRPWRKIKVDLHSPEK